MQIQRIDLLLFMESDNWLFAANTPLTTNALWVLGYVDSWNITEIVTHLVEHGYDCPDFRAILALSQPVESDWAPSLERGIRSYGFHSLTPLQAALLVTWEVINATLEARLEPLDGAKLITSLGETVESFEEKTTVFVELVWAYDGQEARRPFGWLSKEQLADRIKDEMKELIGINT